MISMCTNLEKIHRAVCETDTQALRTDRHSDSIIRSAKRAYKKGKQIDDEVVRRALDDVKACKS